MTFFTDEQIELLSSKAVKIDFLVKLEFLSETVYLWNGDYDLTIGGNVYKALHGTGQIEGLGQSSNAQSEAISLKLYGLQSQTPDLLSLALQDTPDANQQLVTIYLQLFDSDWQATGNPIPVWWGFMQPPRVELSEMSDEQGSIQIITVDAENAFYNRSRPPYGRYTDRDQQKRSDGDKFFQFVPNLLFKTITWPDY